MSKEQQPSAEQQRLLGGGMDRMACVAEKMVTDILPPLTPTLVKVGETCDAAKAAMAAVREGKVLIDVRIFGIAVIKINVQAF
jgi:hypothetical protein